MEIILKGAMISGALIIAIGGQNAFVLKQGLLKNNVLPVVLTCFICDFLLMSLGVLGLGSLISQSKVLSISLAAAGGVFLFWYGLRSFRAALRSSSVLNAGESSSRQTSTRQAITTTLAITLLNPHVYLDTVVIVGGIAATLPIAEKAQFLIGALLVSFLWFMTLGYGARALLPLFKNPKAWRILEFLIGCTMWWIAFELIKFAVVSV